MASEASLEVVVLLSRPCDSSSIRDILSAGPTGKRTLCLFEKKNSDAIIYSSKTTASDLERKELVLGQNSREHERRPRTTECRDHINEPRQG